MWRWFNNIEFKRAGLKNAKVWSYLNFIFIKVKDGIFELYNQTTHNCWEQEEKAQKCIFSKIPHRWKPSFAGIFRYTIGIFGPDIPLVTELPNQNLRQIGQGTRGSQNNIGHTETNGDCYFKRIKYRYYFLLLLRLK